MESFWGYHILWHFLAIVLTYIIVTSGFDWTYFSSTRGDILRILLFPAIVIGGILPLLLPITLLVVGHGLKKSKMIMTAWALGQAAFIGLLISSTYKAFTGRIQPNLANITTDISRKFQFGFWRHGVFWGWPSSHTTIAFAMAFSLVLLYPHNKFVKYLAPFYALYIGLGISISIHWFSEFIAGAIIGTVIGIVVGKSFYKLLSIRIKD